MFNEVIDWTRTTTGVLIFLFYFTNYSISNLHTYVCHFFSIVHNSDIVTYGREGVSEWSCIIGHVDGIGVLLAFYS